MDQGKDYDNVETLTRIAGWCKEYNIKFKINSVTCKPNVDEDMSKNITLLNPSDGRSSRY